MAGKGDMLLVFGISCLAFDYRIGTGYAPDVANKVIGVGETQGWI